MPYILPPRIALLLVGGALLGLAPAQADDPAMMPHPVSFITAERHEDGQRRFQGIPGLARAPGGRLWATWYAGGVGEGPDNYVVLVTSLDEGATWSKIRFVVDPPGEVRTFDPVVWVDPQGRLWWFYSQSYRWWDGRAGVWAVVTEDPDSPRPRWSSPRRISDGVMMQKPTVLANGEWLLPIAVWTHAPVAGLPADHPRHVPASHLRWGAADPGTHVYASTDHGKTFSRRGTANIADVRFAEHMIVERRDGSLWLLARTMTGIAESVSSDGGRTWTDGRASSIPHIGSRFFIRRLHSGRLLLVKHNPPIDALWAKSDLSVQGWRQRSHLTAYVSDDDGRTWAGGLVLDERVPVSYPDGDQAPDGTIYIINDFDRHGMKEIVMARFKEQDVLARRMISPSGASRLLVNRATGEDSH